MRKVWVIAAREYKAAVKTKSFIIGIVLLPLMMSGGFLANNTTNNVATHCVMVSNADDVNVVDEGNIELFDDYCQKALLQRETAVAFVQTKNG